MNQTNRRQFITTVAAASSAISTNALSAVENNSSITFQEAVRNVPLKMDADVIVCGAGPDGVTAAISAARAGAKVRLFEAHGSLGGVWTSSLLGYPSSAT